MSVPIDHLGTRVLVLAPTRRDAEVTRDLLARSQVSCVICPDIHALGREAEVGAGAILLTEEALTGEGVDSLLRVLRREPAWSEVPMVVLMRGGAESPAAAEVLRKLGNVTLLERPAPIRSVASVVEAAVRGRLRQYEIRDYIDAVRRSEQAVRDSEARFRQLADSIPQLAWTAQPDGEIFWYNQRWYQYTGTTAEQMRDSGWHRVHDPRFLPRVLERWEASLRTGQPFEMEFPIRGADGRFGWFLTRVVPLLDALGQTVMWFGTNTDLTQSKRIAEALRENEGKLQLAVRTARLGLLELDLRTNALICSETCKANYGRGPRDHFSSQDFWDCIDRDDVARVRETVGRAIEGRADFETEYRNRWPDGSNHWVIVRGSISCADDGQALRLIGVSLDITDRKRVEQEREMLLEAERAARVEAERAVRMKDEFLATVSHELRTPLNAILGWSQLLRQGTSDPEDLSQGLETIERSARAQTQLIEDLLDMSRIVSGRLRLDIQSVDACAIVHAAVETIHPATQAKGVRLQKLLDPLIGPVAADPTRLQQIVWNLLSNAVKFTPRGGEVTLRVARVDSSIEISVADTGQGIPSEFLPHVFDRFRQADGTSTRRYGGLGLGLSIVKHLAELHGGTVRASSAGPGQGSTFVVSLPVSVVPQPINDKSSFSSGVGGDAASDGVTNSLEGLRIMAVDDDADARELLRRILIHCRADVQTCCSGAEALKVIQGYRPDVLISDIGMPELDGYEFIRLFRAQGGRAPAIALTAFARSEDRTRALRAGYAAHVAKPVEPAELIATVASVARRLNV